jgi:hypothetical protein
LRILKSISRIILLNTRDGSNHVLIERRPLGNQPGERDKAGRLAHALVSKYGTWEQVLAFDMPDDERLLACFDHFGLLTEWEQQFCQSLIRFQRLSEKQSKILERIYQKVKHA